MVNTPSRHHRKHVSKARAFKDAKHVSTPSTLARQARGHASTPSTWARKHVSTPSTQPRQVRDLADSATHAIVKKWELNDFVVHLS